MWSRLALALILALSVPALAQMVDVTDESSSSNPPVGREKAQEYFQTRKGQPAAPRAPYRSPASEGLGAPRYLAVHIGSYFTDNGYKWGDGDQENIGKLNAGVTYRMGEWVNSMDLSLRIDFTNYELDEGDARKISFGTILTFPDANSAFPLYFGVGLGAGFFIKQINDESVMSLDYSLLAGVRFFNVFETVGLMAETGLKNHLHLFSDGQYDGVYFNVGCVFAF